MRSKGYSTWSVILSICLLSRFLPLHTTRQPKRNTNGLSVTLKNGKLCILTAFKSYGMKTKWTSQSANEHGLPRPDSAHDGGSRSDTKGEYA